MPVACHREDLGRPGCVLFAERGQELITVPDVVGTFAELTMIIFRVRIKAGRERALLGAHLAQQPGQRSR